MKLEVGKTYVNRNGAVVKITHEGNFKDFPFVGNAGRSYTEYGRAMLSEETIFDLIAEHTPDEQKQKEIFDETEEWITTETAEGFRAVLCYAYSNRSGVFMREQGRWSGCPKDYSVDTLLNWVIKDNTVYGIKNPNFKPPKKPEVGDLVKFNGGDGDRIGLVYALYEEDTFNCIYYNKHKGFLATWRNMPQDWIIECLDEKIDLSALEADENE